MSLYINSHSYYLALLSIVYCFCRTSYWGIAQQMSRVAHGGLETARLLRPVWFDMQTSLSDSMTRHGQNANCGGKHMQSHAHPEKLNVNWRQAKNDKTCLFMIVYVPVLAHEHLLDLLWWTWRTRGLNLLGDSWRSQTSYLPWVHNTTSTCWVTL